MGATPQSIHRWLSEHGIARPRARFESIDGEIWNPVAGWEGTYEVSNLGRVRGLDRVGYGGVRIMGRILRPIGGMSKRVPYPLVALSRGGRQGERYYRFIHKLVLEAFVGPRPAGMEACHNNGDAKDNRLSNLRWDTHVSNMEDNFAHGKARRRVPRYLRDGWRTSKRGRKPDVPNELVS